MWFAPPRWRGLFRDETKMAFDLSSITYEHDNAPFRLMLVGIGGIGKTSFAARAPDPIFVQVEQGLGKNKVAAFPFCATTADVMECLQTLYGEAHDFKTVVIDSADWLDAYIQADVREAYSEKDLAYGKEALYCATRWKNVLDWLDALRRDRAMNAILIAHCEVKTFNPPDMDSYERYQPKLGNRANALVQEWADMVLFAGFRTIVKHEDGKDKRKEAIGKAITTGERLLHTGEKPSYVAKNRYSLPDVLPFRWNSLAEAIGIEQNPTPEPFDDK